MKRDCFTRCRGGMLAVIIVSILVCSINIAALQTRTAFARVRQFAPSNTAVLTYKNDASRSGLNPNETILTTTNVNVNQFGERISYGVDGQVYAQPLYVPNLTIGGGTHNVVFVATEHDSVYAFDADQIGFSLSSNFLWHTSFINPPNVTTVSMSDVNCADLTPEIGITSTPVIDLATNTIYVVATTKESGAIVYRLHALDITTGKEKTGSSTIIQASVAGTGDGSSNGEVPFTPKQERQRTGLLLANGTVYIAWASYCDNDPYHGWVMGYTYNGSAFQQVGVYNESANAKRGGIWQSGGGLAADSSGNIYAMTGNGTFDLNKGGVDAGDTFLKWNAQLQVTDTFTPFNQSCLDIGDVDLGSGGPMVLPAQSGSTPNELIGVGKEGRIYVINRDNMGKFSVDPNLNCSTTEPHRTDIDKVVQELPPNTANGGVWGTFAYWNGPNGQFVYISGSADHMKAFSVTNGMLSTSAKSQSPEGFTFPSADPVVSSNGTNAGTGIVWVIDPRAVLRAYDASNLSTELYNSAQIANRDGLDSYVKFSVPTVANGEVFVGTKTSLTIFGELPPTAPNNIGTSDDGNPSAANFDGGGNSYSAQALQGAGITQGATINFNNVNFTWPNAAPGNADNYRAVGQTIQVTPVGGATTLAFLGSSSNGPSNGTATILYSNGSTQTFSLGFSDWTLGGGHSAPSYSNGAVAVTPYRNTSTGKQTVNTYIFYAAVALQSGKTVKSVTLPTSLNRGQMHVFSIATATSVGPVGYNNIGTSDDSNPRAANYDHVGYSYSAQALKAVGVMPNGFVTSNGVSFLWPSPGSGVANNYEAGGQTIYVTRAAGRTRLAFLGSATNGASSGTITIKYTDGTTQTVILGYTDWAVGSTSFGNNIVVKMPYRNGTNGKQNLAVYVFYADVGLQSGKIVQSVTLPSSTKGGQLHVFSFGTR